MPLWLVRTYRAMRARRSFSVLFVFMMLAVSVLGNTLTFYFFERDQEPTLSDALWYSIISITTIGYGDFSASTAGGRLGTVLFIVVFGLATFSVAMSFGIDWVDEIILKGRAGMSDIHASDHIVIVNFPSHARVAELIDELKAHPEHRSREIVIVSDRIESLPIEDKHVLFVQGPVLQQETYERAKIGQARMVIVLATSYDDPSSDAVVASAVAVVESLNRDVYSVAECLNYKHRMLFDSVHTNALVYSMKVSGNLLSLEAHDTGVAQLIDTITSNQRDAATLYSLTVGDEVCGLCYRELAKQLLDRDIHLLGIVRNEESLLTFGERSPEVGDLVLYIAAKRVNWANFCRFNTN
ncbi:potassium channel protein [Roseiconus lacunae]|uniref:Potassium channel family protein n=1 Tax=Roseiconus lacunae TaxID=2605694 RepID=A0ABT7PNI4_9BACT|nr:potassium channel family protein [Roseiconus lacunae]MDM4018035.1 potassium channel family protein [Roseiconus lacunae]